MEFPAVAAEQHPLATVYQQDNLVRHVGGQLQRERTPVDEIVLIREPGAVRQQALAPVHRLVPGKGGQPQCGEEHLFPVGKEVQVIATLARELARRIEAVPVAVSLLQVFRTDHPMVGVLRVGAHRYPGVVAEAVAVFPAHVVRQPARELYAPHSGQAPLGVCLVHMQAHPEKQDNEQ